MPSTSPTPSRIPNHTNRLEVAERGQSDATEELEIG